MKTSRLLRIYLQDHDALALLAVQLIRRTRASNPSGPLAGFLDEMEDFADRHRRAVRDAMDRVEVKPRHDKRTALWVAERLGRLKLNGRLVGYSDLSRLIELEGIEAVTTMNRSLWESLRALAAKDERLAGLDFEGLVSEARRLHEELGNHRIEAATRLSD